MSDWTENIILFPDSEKWKAGMPANCEFLCTEIFSGLAAIKGISEENFS